MPHFQDLVGMGNVAYVEDPTNVIKGAPLIDVTGLPNNVWIARKNNLGQYEFPTDKQMFNYGEAATMGFDPTPLALTGNVCTYAFSTYRKVKTAAPSAITTIAQSTINAITATMVGGGLILFPQGATPFAINMPASTTMVEHGRPSSWTANKDYIALILKFDTPHLFWLAEGTRLS